jgi:diadenylate cyclase
MLLKLALAEKTGLGGSSVKEEQIQEKVQEKVKEEKHQKGKSVKDTHSFLDVLKLVAPGTPLREGLESILRARMGALIVVGDSQEILDLVEGGFRIDTDFTPANLYELAKMDGAIILSSDAKRILYANAQLIPDPTIPSSETGIRHRTAERVARQTGALVIAISQRRSVITLYKGVVRYILQDIAVILSKANQAIQTLEKYKGVFDKALLNLTALEFEDLVTVYDVCRVVQRGEMVMRIVRELQNYIGELGTEGRLVKMQVEELVSNVEEELLHVIQDYYVGEDKDALEIRQAFASWTSEELLDLTNISRALGYGAAASSLDLNVYPRGYRLLQKLPRLPFPIIENLVQTFGNLQNIVKASIEELDDVEGIGEVRARSIKNGLRRLQEQVMLDRYL